MGQHAAHGNVHRPSAASVVCRLAAHQRAIRPDSVRLRANHFAALDPPGMAVARLFGLGFHAPEARFSVGQGFVLQTSQRPHGHQQAIAVGPRTRVDVMCMEPSRSNHVRNNSTTNEFVARPSGKTSFREKLVTWYTAARSSPPAPRERRRDTSGFGCVNQLVHTDYTQDVPLTAAQIPAGSRR